MKIVKYNELDENFFKYIEYDELSTIKEFIQKVKENGDKALIDISANFGENISSIEVPKAKMEECVAKLNKDTKWALKKAIKQVRDFAEKQFECIKELSYCDSNSTLGHRIIPLKRIGAYVPGGRYPLPSSAIMTIIPAKVAGVEEVIVCSPKIDDITIAAASLSGANRIFNVGGAQAIAAMAYGTETIPEVDKIVGPGNKYVTMAKREVYGKCGIDFLAGPSEILIVADDTAIPAYIAADLLSQAEHDADAQSILITTSDKLIKMVTKELDEQLEKLETKETAKQALLNSFIIKIDSLDEAILISNKKAPEHLQLCFDKAEELSKAFTNYGSLFIGNYSAEVFGDYCSGTNHVLPTNGVARYTGGLSVFDFVKIQTYQVISKELAKEILIPVSSHIANLEGLMAHKNAALIRE
ncbi:MAG: histidinol dehydrogenase [Vampirovibrionia bacterium]